MFRVVAVLLAGSVLAAAPVPEEPKVAKERRLLLAELGLPDTGQKFPAVPADHRSDAVTDADVKANPKKYAVRAACGQAATALLAAREKPLPQTLSFVQGTKKAKQTARELQLPVAKLTLELEEARDAIEELTAADREAEKSPRWRAHHDYLKATVEQEIAILNEYNLALGHVLTETQEPPAGEFNALRLEPSDKMRSNRTIRAMGQEAAEMLTKLATTHAKTPWGALADTAKDRRLGLAWVPTKAEAKKIDPKKIDPKK